MLMRHIQTNDGLTITLKEWQQTEGGGMTCGFYTTHYISVQVQSGNDVVWRKELCGSSEGWHYRERAISKFLIEKGFTLDELEQLDLPKDPNESLPSCSSVGW